MMELGDENIQTIYEQTMLPDGFLWLSRENQIDEAKFDVLIAAIKNLAEKQGDERFIDKLVVACLFDAPYELENTVEHYSQIDAELGQKVSKMADALREATGNLLWKGLEDYYESIE